MSYADQSWLGGLLTVLGSHSHAAYAVLFLGAFFETLFPFSLAVMGEVFFLAGALLAGVGTLDLWAVVVVLYGGGLLGDNASYWMGRHYGVSLYDRLGRWPLARRLAPVGSYEKGVQFFHRHGAAAVLAARLSGPLSWITPAMAGTFHLDYAIFLRFNALGVVLGIGQFIVVGYFFGSHLDDILAWLDRFGVTILAAILTAATAIAWRARSTSQAGTDP